VVEPNGFVYARVLQPDDERAWSSPVWVRGACVNGSACIRSRLVRGGGAAEEDCLVEWLRPASLASATSVGVHLSCADGDPSCDFGDTAGECTVRVGLCVGVADARLPGCFAETPETLDVLLPGAGVTDRASADFQNRQAALAMFHALRPFEDGSTCSPLSEIRVPVGRERILTRAEAGTRVDDDELVVECRSTTARRRGPTVARRVPLH
jgi:hypothetical protein